MFMNNFINLNTDNIENEHLCCIIRTKTKHEGVETKRRWLKKELTHHHIFRKIDDKVTAFIEYDEVENALVPVVADNFYYIYCLWVTGDVKGKGYGKELLEYAINDAKANHKSGICMLGATKQKAWLSSEAFLLKNGFKVTPDTAAGYHLVYLSFDGTIPTFSSDALKESVSTNDLTIYYSDQCPFILKAINDAVKVTKERNIPLNLIHITSRTEALKIPAPFNNYALFYKGKFITVNLLQEALLNKLLDK